MLSKRLLVFTDHQTSFYCSASSWAESFGEMDLDSARHLEAFPSVLFPGLSPSKLRAWRWYDLADILEMYSSRFSTKEDDTLTALAGIVNHIQKIRPDIQLLRGLPFYKTCRSIAYDARIESLEELVTAALSWHAFDYDMNTCRRKPTFPSWTWAGWISYAWFWMWRLEEATYQSFLQHVRLEGSDGQAIATVGIGTHDMQHNFNKVTLIEFDAPTISDTYFSNADDGSTSDADSDYLGCKVAGRSLLYATPPNTYTRDELIGNLRKGIWSCLMLGAGDSIIGEDHCKVFFLVVCWRADRVVAERIGSFEVHSTPAEDENLGAFKDKKWERRLVRLV